MGVFVGVVCTVGAYNDPDFHGPVPAPQPTETLVVVKTVPAKAPPRTKLTPDCAQAQRLATDIQRIIIDISKIRSDVGLVVHDANTAIVARDWKELQRLTETLRANADKNDPLFASMIDANNQFQKAADLCKTSS
jgi:hypothetical protein